MQCSDCRHTLRPVAVWDIDGTLGEYHMHLARFAWDYWNMQHPNQPQWDGEGDFETWLGMDKPMYREAKLAFRQGGMKRTMNPYTGGLEMIKHFYSLGMEVWVCTARPWQRLDNVDPDTKFWLAKHQVPYYGLLFGENKYADLLQTVDPRRVLAVFEDLPEEFDAAEKCGFKPIQIKRHHNVGTSQQRTPRLTFAQATTVLAERLDEWNNKYGG